MLVRLLLSFHPHVGNIKRKNTIAAWRMPSSQTTCMKHLLRPFISSLNRKRSYFVNRKETLNLVLHVSSIKNMDNSSFVALATENANEFSVKAVRSKRKFQKKSKKHLNSTSSIIFSEGFGVIYFHKTMKFSFMSTIVWKIWRVFN